MTLPQLSTSPTRLSPPKRKSSELASPEHGNPSTTPTTANGHATADNNEATRRCSSGGLKPKRRKVNHACVYCRRSHMTCDLERPCARCVKRDIGHLCHDEPREPVRRSKSDATAAVPPATGVNGLPEIAPAPKDPGPMERRNTAGGAESWGLDMRGAAGLMQQSPAGSNDLYRTNSLASTTAANTAANTGSMNTGQPQQHYDYRDNSMSQPVQNHFQDMHHLHPNYLFNNAELTNEYNLLNDFLSTSLLDDGVAYNTDDAAQTLFADPLLATSSFNALTSQSINPQLFSTQQQQSSNQPQIPPQHQPTEPPASSLQPPPTASSHTKAGLEISRPSSARPDSKKAQDTYFLTAADPSGLDSASNRLHKLLKAKYDAGMLKPFNYVKGYARLQAYMSRYFHPASQRRILEQLSRFRPKFRESMQNLSDVQLVMVEMWFERSLMEYDRVFASMAIPACCWRRTGEIYRGNHEMADLIGVPLDRLRDGKLAIHEIIGEESLVSYWEKFGAIAFDQSQKAILTSCVLKKPGPEKDKVSGFRDEKGKEAVEKQQDKENEVNVSEKDGKVEKVRCCFSFTIRRDPHNM